MISLCLALQTWSPDLFALRNTDAATQCRPDHLLSLQSSRVSGDPRKAMLQTPIRERPLACERASQYHIEAQCRANSYVQKLTLQQMWSDLMSC